MTKITGVDRIMILEFQGEHRYLSNFAMCDVMYDDVLYLTSETAYQAQKSANPYVRTEMARMFPGAAKRAGRGIKLRPDWEQVKDQVMYEVVYAKFAQNSGFAKRLVATGDTHIEEGNRWGDRYWGVSPVGSGNGLNKLGEILMRIRKEIA